jgi:hypothetical protein
MLFYGDILYGKVKQVSEMQYSAGSVLPDLKDTTWYDEKGSTFDFHRKTVHGSFITEKYTYSKDVFGRKIGIVSNLQDQNISAKLDCNGNITEYSSLFKDGRPNFKSLYEYDSRNNFVKFRSFDKDDVLTQMKTYKYDKDDLLIEQDYWKQDGTLDHTVTFKYSGFDKAGNWTKRTSQQTSASGKASTGITIERQFIYY